MRIASTEDVEFFNLVRGKKIRHTRWNNGHYFIPRTLTSDSILEGECYYEGIFQCHTRQFIGNGFESSQYNNEWEYYSDPSDEHCDSSPYGIEDQSHLFKGDCQHNWKLYEGVMYRYEYCTKCDDKKDLT